MSTRCTIAKRNLNGGYSAIYCHHDGYNDGCGVGPNLRKYFDTQEKVDELINLGDISGIEGTRVIAYYRDKRERWSATRSKYAPSFHSLRKIAIGMDAEYLYVFEDDTWHCKKLV